LKPETSRRAKKDLTQEGCAYPLDVISGEKIMTTWIRNLYNVSPQMWRFQIYPSSGSDALMFQDGVRWARDCYLLPGHGAEIYYVNAFWSAPMSGTMIITDRLGHAGSWVWSGNGFDAPAFQHDGSTGAAVFNDPANGDVKVWAPSWNGG
jgi:hypothetical protein